MTRGRAMDIALIAGLGVVGAYHLALTLSTVASYGLVHPLQDEFRLSYRYLIMPFPDSILAIDNAHRPVIPGLLRWIGLVHFNGSQMPQTLVTASCAAISAAAILHEVRRGLRQRVMLGVAAACLLSSLLLWNANWRMFIHSNEAAHLFIVTAFAVAAIASAMAAADKGRPALWTVAVAFCVAATFSFGNGIAAFAAIATVAVLRRASAGIIAGIAVAAVATLAAYTYGMPGSDGVRGTLETSQFRASVLFSIMRLGAAFVESARPRVAVALAMGVACITIGVAIAIRHIRGAPVARLQVFAAALFAFGAASNVIIAVSRTAYFFVYPDEIFAARYLYWSALLWMASGIYLLASLRDSPAGRQRWACLAVLVFAALAIHPALEANSRAKGAYEQVETGAVALRLELPLDRQIDAISDGGPQVARRLAGELRRRGLGDFEKTPELGLGSRIPIDAAGVVQFPAVSTPAEGGHGKIRQVRVTLPRGTAASVRKQFWITDFEGRIVGAAAMAGQSRFPRNALRLGLPRFDTLVGWIEVPPGTTLIVVEAGDEGRFHALGKFIT